jgi:predicted nucleic acid-binding protein
VLVLDTNVVSELLRPTPSLAVVGWFKAQQRPALFITAVTQAELLEGVARLPKGKRQAALAAAVQGILAEDFADQILPFDGPAAASYADIAAKRRRSGRPLGIFDGLIAGICHARGMALATHNGADFEGCGVSLVDPWRA